MASWPPGTLTAVIEGHPVLGIASSECDAETM